MQQNNLQKLAPKAPPEAALESVPTSRRGLFLGMFAASAFALSMAPNPARAAVSMLRTGVDPELIEPEGNQPLETEYDEELDSEAQLEEVGYYRGRRRRRRRRYGRRRGYYWGRRRRRRPRFGLWIRI